MSLSRVKALYKNHCREAGGNKHMRAWQLEKQLEKVKKQDVEIKQKLDTLK